MTKAKSAKKAALFTKNTVGSSAVRANVKTVSNLLRLAAERIVADTNTKTGEHRTVEEALSTTASDNGFLPDVVLRATREFHVMYHTDYPVPRDAKKKHQTFGKNFSATRSKYALENTLKNRDSRVNALLACSEACKGHHTTWPSKL